MKLMIMLYDGSKYRNVTLRTSFTGGRILIQTLMADVNVSHCWLYCDDGGVGSWRTVWERVEGVIKVNETSIFQPL